MQHSWNWIAARLSPRRIWNNTSPSPHRPCLPSIEQLGDRVMLSANSSSEGGPPTGDSAILAAVIKGELPLVMSEQNLLTLAGNGLTDKTLDDFHKLTDAFAKIDQVIYESAKEGFAKIGDIKGESLDDKHKDEIEVISINFSKIEVAYKALTGGGENQLPAVQLETDALSLLKLVQSSGGGDLDHKTEDLYTKITDGFGAFDQTIIKVQSDLITHRKAGKTQQEFLKMSDALLANINQVTDPNLKATLLGIEAQTLGVVNTLLKIDTGGNDGGDGGGGTLT